MCRKRSSELKEDLEFPDELEMLELLPVVSSRVEPEDSLYWYDFKDSNRTLLRLSFSAIERSVQTDLYVADELLTSISQDGAISLRIRQDKEGNNILVGDFGITLHPDHASGTARLTVHFYPRILVNWSTFWEIDYGQLN